ncbi:RagB/SusD family nutrient uptake outer membrane protein [Saccharicrinis sp. 156]|uniref:RagB/SusD family nutrient uptake outer membrane protein n=1 Tax=Saccharicrinis sp. 156 TaxID=3417574 RepID=UPI003D353861
MKTNIYKLKTSGKLFLSLTLILFTIVSCSESFLEIDPQQDVSMSEALTTESDFATAIIGCYDGLQDRSSYGKFFIAVADVMSDDVKAGLVTNRIYDWHSYSGSSADFTDLADDIWANYYRIIDRANRILEAGSGLDVDEFYGQAYAFRALAHFDLVRIYGQHYTYSDDASHLGVPIVTAVDVLAEPARNTVAEVYAQVISDFETALTLIGDDANSFYFSQNVVKALLSRVYLYKEDWENAEAMANEVIESGDYSLVEGENYSSIFSGDHSSETIFEVDMTVVDNLGAAGLAGNYVINGYNEFLPTTDLMNAYEDGDVRKENNFLYDSTLGGGLYGNYRADKFKDILGYENTPIIRLSELYLIRAEAAYHLNTPVFIAEAQADVTTIRKRGLSTADAVTSTGQELLEEILLERRRELCYEGHRLWDLTRNKLGVYRDDCTTTACSIDYPNDGFILAIGEDEMEVNENMIQNSGY